MCLESIINDQNIVMKNPTPIPVGKNREDKETHLLDQFDFDKKIDQEEIK